MTSCSPKISTSISKNYSALDYREDVVVLGLEDAVPENAELLRTVKNGTSTQTFKSDSGSYENLSRIDLSIGLRFNK